jgi:signal transduction histidine kinase
MMVFLPIIILVVMLQLLVQIVYINRILCDENLGSNERTFWIAVIVLLNIFGIIGYLIFTREKTFDYSKIQDIEMDDNVNSIISLGLVIVYLAFSLAIIHQNRDNALINLLLSLILLLSYIKHFYPIEKWKVLYFLVPILQIGGIIGVNYIASTSDFKMIIIIVVVNILNEYPMDYSKVFASIPLILFILIEAIKTFSVGEGVSTKDLITFSVRNSLTYILIVFTFYIAKKQQVLNMHLQVLMREIKEKNKKLEEVKIMEERNRIAREIHDTLGHTLTGVIIQLEAAKKMTSIDQHKAFEMIEKTQEITRAGFSDVKRAIKTLRPTKIEENTLRESIDELFEYIQKNFDYTIDYELDIPECISDELKVAVYRCFQETITNSLRHGKATHLKITVEHQNKVLRILCEDNGLGSDEIHEGVGLSGIRERFDAFDAQVYFSTSKEKGFSTLIYIPIISN